MLGSVVDGRIQNVGRADTSTSASAQLPLLCVFHFFSLRWVSRLPILGHVLPYLQRGRRVWLASSMRRRRLTAQYNFFWEEDEIQIRGAARVFAANSVQTFFFVEMTTIGPLIPFTKSEGGTLQALYI